MVEKEVSVEEVNWWHTFNFPEFQTKGTDNSPMKVEFIKFPEKIEGSVLDMGAWDGYFSFLAEKRGADRVVALETIGWQEKYLWDPHINDYKKHTGKLGFDTAKEALKSKVESIEVDINDMTVETVGKFDNVFCFGILYHMKHPFKIMEEMCKIAQKHILIETHTDGNYLNVPAMMFYPRAECNNDPSNWWAPNVLSLIEMLKLGGFKATVEGYNPQSKRVAIHATKIK